VDAEIPHWKDDTWYWSKEATDWGWDWAPEEQKYLHPKYVPVYRYARDIIGCLNNHVSGWIDWNMILNRQGGPNWAENWCVAPVIVDPDRDEVYFTPLYYTLAHFSKFIRPGATRIGFNNPDSELMITAAENPDYIARTGWTTQNLIQGINSILKEEKEYNLVSVLIGVNNQYQGIAISSYEPDLRNIMDRALEILAQDTSQLFMVSIPDYAYTPFGAGRSSISEEIDEYNQIKKRIAEEYGIPFINITPISREGLEIPSLVASDGLHPSGEQYSRWVEAILDQLDF
jgi:hypothetical protein